MAISTNKAEASFATLSDDDYIAAVDGGTNRHGVTTVQRIRKLDSHTVANAPAAASYEGKLIYVSNGATGSPCLAYSNGTNWLRITLGAAIATS